MSTQRHDGWTWPRQVDFIRRLSYHGVVTRAADEVGMAVETAYRLRARDPRFANLWDMALEAARLDARDALRKAPGPRARPANMFS